MLPYGRGILYCSRRNLSGMSAPKILINHGSSKTILYTDQVSVEVVNCLPSTKVCILSRLDDGAGFSAVGHYLTDESGSVNLVKHGSKSGSFQGIRPMGLVTHQMPNPGTRPGDRFKVNDVSKPTTFHLDLLKGWLSREEALNSTPITSTSLERHFMAAGVRRIPVEDKTIRGTLFIPPGAGPFPCTVDMYGSAGGLLEFRGALLASQGVMTLCLAYFGYKDLPDHYLELNMEYFEEAVKLLHNHPQADVSRLSILGMSKGGELAQMAACLFPQIRKCAVINSLHFVNDGSLSYRGVRVKTTPYFAEGLVGADGVSNIRSVAGDPYNPVPESVFPHELHTARLLFIAGEEDAMTPAADCARAVQQKLRKAGHGDRIETLILPKTGHLIEPPYTAHCDVIFHRLFGGLLACGGSRDEHADATFTVWKRLVSFLKEHDVPSLQLHNGSIPQLVTFPNKRLKALSANPGTGEMRGLFSPTFRSTNLNKDLGWLKKQC